jgi:hypothetical protein
MGLISVNFIVNRPVKFGKGIFISGNSPELGNWDPSKAVKLFWSEGHNWRKVVMFHVS